MAGAVLNFCFEVAMYVFLTYVFLSILLGRQVGKETRRDFEKDMGKADTGLFYYVLIPGLNESLVIENTLKNMIRHQFHGRIIMIDDFSDDGTADIAERTARLDDRILVLRRHPPRSHIGKGDSLDQAMDFVRSDCQVKHRDMNEVVIGVVDADGGLSETTFEQLNTFFSSPQNVVCQLRVKMDAPFENALQASQDLEFFTVNNMSQNMRMRTHTVGLSGNGQFFRLAPVM